MGKQIYWIVSLAMIFSLIHISTFYKENWLYDWSSVRPELRDTIYKLDIHNRISEGIVGIEGNHDPYFTTQIWLWKNATEEELYSILEYSNGNLRAIAYKGLFYREIESPYNLFNKAIEDTSYQVYYQSGCVVRPVSIADYLNKNVFQVLDDSIKDSIKNVELNN